MSVIVSPGLCADRDVPPWARFTVYVEPDPPVTSMISAEGVPWPASTQYGNVLGYPDQVAGLTIIESAGFVLIPGVANWATDAVFE